MQASANAQSRQDFGFADIESQMLEPVPFWGDIGAAGFSSPAYAASQPAKVRHSVFPTAVQPPASPASFSRCHCDGDIWLAAKRAQMSA